MVNFEKCIPIILNHEGGAKYTEITNDPGGATKYGISLLFLKTLDLVEGDIDHDGDIDKDDIKSLSQENATHLYKIHFWDKLNIDTLSNDLLCLHIFDHAVNAGTITAKKLIQRVVNVTDDGIIGNGTLKAINNFQGDIVAGYIKKRLEYYDSIIIKNEKLEKFRNGWYNRVNSTHF